MRQLSWKEKKDIICTVIKSISDHYGGDEKIFLNDYCKDLIEVNKDCLDKLLLFFKEQKRSCAAQNVSRSELKSSICPNCKYVPPFCRCSDQPRCTRPD